MATRNTSRSTLRIPATRKSHCSDPVSQPEKRCAVTIAPPTSLSLWPAGTSAAGSPAAWVTVMA
jgi:hypothetical protein